MISVLIMKSVKLITKVRESLHVVVAAVVVVVVAAAVVVVVVAAAVVVVDAVFVKTYLSTLGHLAVCCMKYVGPCESRIK